MQVIWSLKSKHPTRALRGIPKHPQPRRIWPESTSGSVGTPFAS